MFVVFEGIDGSGKTTISNLVVERLRARGISVKHLRAEGKFVSAVTENIRGLARDSRNLDLDPRAEFLLYVARDVQLIEEALRSALESHDVVIADRFLYTAEVLGRFGRNLPVEYVQPVLAAAAGGLSPDLVVLVDVDPVLARARRKASKLVAKDVRPPSRKGLSGVGLQHRVRRGYLQLAAEAPERWAVVRNEARLEDSVAQVAGLVEGAVRQGARSALARFQSRSQESTLRPAATLRTPEQALDAFVSWVTERAEREPQVAAYLLGGLAGAPVDGLRRALAARVPPVMLAGLRGLTDDLSWELRETLAKEHATAVARSLGGLAALDPRAPALRAKLVVEAPADAAAREQNEALLRTLGYLDSALAWDLRERLYPSHPDAVIGSLAGVDGERAWALRDAWLSRHGKALGQRYELACTAARSVQGLGSERAFALRERAKEAAPLEALSSLAGLVCARSFERRAHYLWRAPKLVLGTLSRVDHPRAWEMRLEVAGMVKEALDGIAGFDGEGAWQLRDDHADRWASTVVKSLGPLADLPRGRALLERQLERHAGNVSLMKHAACIALGLHRRERSHEE